MRRLLAVLVVLALTACDSGGPAAVIGTGGSGSGLTGTYTLRTVNGATPPAVYRTQGTTSYEILDDAFSIGASGSWTEVGHVRVTVNGGEPIASTLSDAGTYTTTSNSITLTSTAAGTSFTMVLGDGTMTLTNASYVLVYSK